MQHPPLEPTLLCLRTYQYDDIVKKNEQIYHLLAMIMALCPQRCTVDEVLLTTLKERLNEKVVRLEQGDLDAFSEMFKYACPKFISFASNFNDDRTDVAEPLETQRNLFLKEVSSSISVLSIM